MSLAVCVCVCVCTKFVCIHNNFYSAAANIQHRHYLRSSFLPMNAAQGHRFEIWYNYHKLYKKTHTKKKSVSIQLNAARWQHE